jgi:hypothetical protein
MTADNLIAIKEAHEAKSGDYFPIAFELEITADKGLNMVSQCHIDFVLMDGDKKGIEGAAYIDNGDNGEFLLALCEGNYCEVWPSQFLTSLSQVLSFAHVSKT